MVTGPRFLTQNSIIKAIIDLVTNYKLVNLTSITFMALQNLFLGFGEYGVELRLIKNKFRDFSILNYHTFQTIGIYVNHNRNTLSFKWYSKVWYLPIQV